MSVDIHFLLSKTSRDTLDLKLNVIEICETYTLPKSLMGFKSNILNSLLIFQQRLCGYR
jgi:hypothetical protein